ncbi:MAG TPA: RNA 3'-terminal phosphate cyclase [Planctomycetota bacterium]
MLTLDGSLGEGGGQVLRTSLALSLVTQQPFVIEKIRAGREKPGLKRQHLTAVLAAAEIGDAKVSGAELGSQRLSFAPRTLRGGDFKFAIGTAGSTTLVLQTVLPALLAAPGPSTVVLSGGTHNPLAPPFEFLQHAFAPALRAMGAPIEMQLVRHGFAPAGGGAIAVNVAPAKWSPVQFTSRGHDRCPRARVLLSQLPRSVAERELAVVRQQLGIHPEQLAIEVVDSQASGNMLLLEYPNDHVTEVIAEPGERGVFAETVAERACKRALAFLAVDVPVGEYLADQLLLPMALAGGGVFRTLPPSQHTRTNAQVIERFLPVRFQLLEHGATGACTVEVERA